MEPSVATPKKSKLTLYIIIGLTLGIAVGFALNKTYVAEENRNLVALDVSIEEISQQVHQATDSATLLQLKSKKVMLAKERNAVLAQREKKVEPFSLLADIFLRLIKMIVAPLVFTTLVVGVAKL